MALKSIIKPFYKFMNRLTYSSKFGVMMLLFAVPLVILLSKIFLSSSLELEQARLHNQGVETLQRSHALIGKLEQWRDIAILDFVSSDPEIKQLLAESTQALEESLQQTEMYLRSEGLEKAAMYLHKLEESVNSPSIAAGMEGVSIEIMFDNVHRYIEEANDWQRQLAALYGLLGVQDQQTYSVMNLVLYDTGDAYESMARARVFGSFYLSSGFIDSSGIYVVDKTYANLDKESEKIAGKLSALLLTSGSTELSPDVFVKPLQGTLDIFDQQLIQVTSLDSNWRSYFNQIGTLRDQARETEAQWLFMAGRYFRDLEGQREQETLVLVALTLLLVVVMMLLFAGFFYSVKNTITRLVNSAEAVAGGDLDRVMQTQTRDELSLLGNALDHMREQLKARQVHLHQMSITDGLTGLNNRTHFDQVLEAEINKAVRKQYPVSLILLDIDHFKSINDEFGHLAGDECLKFVAQLFKQFAKRASDTAARFGGEEFAIILPDSPVEDCFAIAEQFRESMQNSEIHYGDDVIKLTVSCGVTSVVPASLAAIPDLIGTADEALYEAKRSGRNRTVLRKPEKEPIPKHG